MSKGLLKPTFWRLVALLLLAAGVYATVIRFTKSLGASTALSDRAPWGLWIGFDVMCGVALAAGGFTISAVVYIFNIERFRPIIRPTLLTAFLGYLLVCVGLLFDLGLPFRIWHPLIHWNHHSVMFEVGWCVTLYTTVLALEFAPIVFERLRWEKPLKIAKAITIPLVIAGVLLSTLHQSSLGSLYLIVPQKLHPLWYSPLLPVSFYVSAIALGCAMMIFESFLSLRAFRKSLEMGLLVPLGKAAAIALGLYGVLRVADLQYRGALSLAFEPSYEGRMFLAEILLGVVAPIVMLAVKRIRENQVGLFAAALMVVLGFMMNRLNVATTGFDAASGANYFPSATEMAVTASIVTAGFIIFGLAVRFLPIFPAEAAPPVQRCRKAELPAMAALGQPLLSAPTLALVVVGTLTLAALGLAYIGIRQRVPAVMVKTVEADMADRLRGIQHYNAPPDVVFDQSSISPGKVTFRHWSHADADMPNCTLCHSSMFKMLKSAQVAGEKADYHAVEKCGSCHNGATVMSHTRVFDLRDRKNCMKCHTTDRRNE
jgi:c(7)-type cytochrome triheme protein